MASKFHIVVATDQRNGIGKNGGLPWQLPGDMAFFKRLTSNVINKTKRNAVIMGRKTWESIPPKFRPLANRLNIVITNQSQLAVPADVQVVNSLEKALQAATKPSVESIFVIGGAAVYAEACQHPQLDRIYWTAVGAEFDCDKFFPDLKEEFAQVAQEDSAVICENGIEYVFKVFQRRTVSSKIPPPF